MTPKPPVINHHSNPRPSGTLAKGSQTGWFGLPPDKRFCAGCGRKVSLKEPGGLWHDDWILGRDGGLVWHPDCRLKAAA